MSRHPAPGDPASIARLATATAAAGRSLGAWAAEPARLPPGAGPTRRVERHLAARLASLEDAVAAVSRELDHGSAALQAHAQSLAAVIAALRALHERGEQAGLVLDAGRWQPGWGITGAADPHDAGERVALAQQWQQEHDALVRTAARRRSELTRELTESRERLASEAARLRLG